MYCGAVVAKSYSVCWAQGSNAAESIPIPPSAPLRKESIALPPMFSMAIWLTESTGHAAKSESFVILAASHHGRASANPLTAGPPLPQTNSQEQPGTTTLPMRTPSMNPERDNLDPCPSPRTCPSPSTEDGRAIKGRRRWDTSSLAHSHPTTRRGSPM